MSEVNRDQVITFLSGLTVVELSELVGDLEDTWGVQAASAVAVAPRPNTHPIIDDEVEFAVELTGFGDKKIQVIKAVRGITGLGLKEAKALVDEVPSLIREGISRDEADALVAQLEDAGGQAVAR
jgi:large subunit ribosomal protein L7/L12